MSYKKKDLVALVNQVFEKQSKGEVPTRFSSRNLLDIVVRDAVDEFIATSRNPAFKEDLNKLMSIFKTFPGERLVIVVTGETHTGKSYLGREIGNALAYATDRVADSAITLYDEETSKHDWFAIAKMPTTNIFVLSNYYRSMRLQHMKEMAHYVIECLPGCGFMLTKARDFDPEQFNKTLGFHRLRDRCITTPDGGCEADDCMHTAPAPKAGIEQS